MTTGAVGATGATGATGAAGAVPSVAPVVNPNNLCAGLTPPSGTVSMTGTAPHLESVSALLDSVRKDSDLAVVWVTTAQAPPTSSGSVQFTVTASLGSSARGQRLETFFRGPKCK